MQSPTQPRIKRRTNERGTPALTPLDPSALVDAVRTLEHKLEAVTLREQEYRQALIRLEDEIRSAGALQRSMMPRSIPDVRGLDVRVLFRPCGDLSGDAYDVFRIDQNHVALTIADATGHGAAAALLSTLIRRSIRQPGSAAPQTDALHPDQVLARVNRELLEIGFDECQFVALLYAVYHEETGVIRWARGGTPFPVLVRNGASPSVIESEGSIVGATPGVRFEPCELTLRSGDQLYFCTDGIEPLIRSGADAGSMVRAWAAINASNPNSDAADDAAICLPDKLARTIDSSVPLPDDVIVLALTRFAVQ